MVTAISAIENLRALSVEFLMVASFYLPSMDRLYLMQQDGVSLNAIQRFNIQILTVTEKQIYVPKTHPASSVGLAREILFRLVLEGQI
ncbi:MAG: hypothetical protein CMN90_12660 [Sutterellaceae bacterium]|nr:hypothetical protein [Sutterellaceae bacterium]